MENKHLESSNLSYQSVFYEMLQVVFSTFFSILPPGRLLAVEIFAQGKNFDPVDFLNLHKIIFSTVYNMSLSKFFPHRT